MIESLKRFYVIAFDSSEILEKAFSRNIDIGDFDDFVIAVHALTDVDIERCQILLKESISWKDYFKDLKALVDFYIDKFLCVQECYDYLSFSINTEKQVPMKALEDFKIQARSVPEIIMELSAKKTAVNSKIEKLKLFNEYLSSYISYLSDVHYRLNGIVMGYGIRYWNSID